MSATLYSRQLEDFHARAEIFPLFFAGGELPPGSATKPCTKGVALPTGDTQTSAIALFSV